jgi:hypothetical protein
VDEHVYPLATVVETAASHGEESMRRRDISKALFAAAAGSAAIAQRAQAQTCTAPCYAQTAAEIAANVTPVNYGYAPYDIRRYGGDPTGGVSSDAAMASAIAVCTGSGGVIRVPVGTYLFNSPIVINNRSGIVIEGDGCETIELGAVTTLKYSGTSSGNWIQITAAFGCGLRKLQLVNTSTSFTSSMVQVATSNFCFADTVTFNTTFTCSHLNLDTAVNFYATQCLFLNGTSSVLGQNQSGSSTRIVHRSI